MKTLNLAVMALALGLALLSTIVGWAGDSQPRAISSGGIRAGGNARFQSPAQSRAVGLMPGGGGRAMGPTSPLHSPVRQEVQVRNVPKKKISLDTARSAYATATRTY